MIKFGTAHGQLGPAPIRAAWVLEGKPVARNKLLSRSADGTASTYIWDCTAGKFNWHYEVDETAYVLEGRVIIKDQVGSSRTLEAGDTAFFPRGSKAEWTVDGYVRKVAFLRVPLPWQVLMAKRFYHALKRLMGSRRSKKEEIVPSMS
jgi:uncharacterized cupin superfamily protein